MRIFFITHTYSLGGSGGGEQFVSAFLQELRRRKHRVFVFTPGGKEFEKKEKALGLEVYHAPTFGHHAFHKFEYVLMSWKAAELAKKFRPDVIHSQNDIFPALIGSAVKGATKKPLVVAVEYLSDQAVSLNLKTVFAINKLLLPRIGFDVIVSWSKFVVQKFFLPWGIEKEKIRLVPGAVDVKRFLKKAKPNPKLVKIGKNLIVSAKPLHSTNAAGLSYVIKAMAIVAKKFPEWKYVIVGEGQSKQMLGDLAKQLGLQKNVFLIGPIENEEMPSVYAASQIVAHSFAFKATTSIALIESMAAGKAIVATRSGEVAPTTADTVMLARQKDAKSIAEGLLKLIENPSLRKQLGEKARARAKEKFGIEGVVRQFEKIYKEAQEKNNGIAD